MLEFCKLVKRENIKKSPGKLTSATRNMARYKAIMIAARDSASGYSWSSVLASSPILGSEVGSLTGPSVARTRSSEPAPWGFSVDKPPILF
jgi:hypothetical protein